MRRAFYASTGGPYGAWAAAWNGIVWIAILLALGWYGMHHAPEVQSAFEQFGCWWQNLIAQHPVQVT